MKDISIKKYFVKNTFLNIFVFSILYITSGYTTRIISGTMQLSILSILAIIALLIQKNLRINRRVFITILTMSFIVIVSSIVNGDSFKNTTIMVAIIFISGIIVNEIKFNHFIKAYLSVMYFTAKFSLGVYALSVFFPNIIRLFPSTYSRIGRETYDLFFTVSNLKLSPMRNMGFFWEPGAYQTFIVLAIILEIFYVKQRSIKKLNILALALVSTLSTTGVIAGILTLILYYLSKKKKLATKVMKITIVLTIVGAIFLISYPYLPESIQHATLGKFKGIFTDSTDVNVSAAVRYNSVYYPLVGFVKHPFFGLGFEGLYDFITINTGYGLATNTPVNWIATYGIFFGAMCYYGVFRLSKILDSSWSTRLVIALTIIITLSSQQFIRNSAILIFIFYGITESLSNKHNL
jgi:hypothetical protein